MAEVLAETEKKVVVNSQGHDYDSDEKIGGGRRKSSLAAFTAGDHNAIEGQLFSMNDVDPALDKKMRIVNNVSADSTLFREFISGLTSLRRSIKSAGQTSIPNCSVLMASAIWQIA